MGAWQERNFRILFVGQATSALGNTLVPVALAFAVLDLTHSASDLGYVLGAGSATMVVFLLAGGVIADRLPRRTVMLSADALRCLSQATLGVLLITGHATVAVLALLTAVTGLATAMFSPASTGLTPALVQRAHLQQANALQQTANAIASVAGPAVAGVLVVTVGPGWALVADAGTFAVNVAMLARLRLETAPRPAHRHFLTDLREGWRDFLGRRWFRDVVFGASAFNLLYAVYEVLGPVSSVRYYDGARTWAIISTATGIGAVAGGVAAIRLRPHRPLLAAGIAILPAALAPLALAAGLPVAAVAAAGALGAAGLIMFESLWQTSVQHHIPEALLSRASSYDYFGSLIAAPAGLVLAGSLSAAVGIHTLLWVSGSLEVALVTGLLFDAPVRRLVNDPVPVAARG